MPMPATATRSKNSSSQLACRSSPRLDVRDRHRSRQRRSSRSAFQRDSAYSSCTSERTVIAAAGAEQVAAVAGGHQAPDHDAEVGAAVGADPAEGAGVRTARGVLDLVDHLHGAQLGGAGHRAGGEQRAQRLHRGDVRAEVAADGADQLVHGLVGLDVHQHRHLDGARLAHHRQVVAEQVHDHQVLGAEPGVARPGARAAARPPPAVAPRGVVPLIGLVSSIRSAVTSAYRSGLLLSSQALGARHVVLQEPGVRRGVELAQPQVRRHRVQVAARSRRGRSGSPRRSCRRAGAPGPARRRWRRRRGVDPRSAGGFLRFSGVATAEKCSGVPDRSGGRRTGSARGRIQTASGSAGADRGGQVGPAGVAEVADPVVVGRPGRELGLQHREDVVADDGRRAADVPGDGPGGGVVASATRRPSSSQPTIERRPDHSRAPPPSSQKLRGCVAATSRKNDDRVGHGVAQEVRDQGGAVLGQDRLGVELHALERQRPVPHAHHHVAGASRTPPGSRARSSAASEW